jgi:oxepin-CoA hydrolase/3-oxo-5,6-dehydrosuberyl-CoA semialdehyde dehydrogenase
VLTIAFDVNDPSLRETLLRHVLVDAVGALCEGAKPAWGKMTAQQMVEHLEWAFALSNGQGFCDCPVPETERERRKAFLYSNRPTPREFMNPLLTTGLPPLRHAGLDEARTALAGEVARFLAQSAATPGLIRAHPVFGSMPLGEWTRSHYKHAYHHLLQFGLIRTPYSEAGRPQL